MPRQLTVILDSGCFLPNHSQPNYIEIGYFESQGVASDIKVFVDGEELGDLPDPFKLCGPHDRKCLIEVRHKNADGSIKKDGVTAQRSFHQNLLYLKDLYGEHQPVERLSFDCVIRFDSGHFRPSMIKKRDFKEYRTRADGSYGFEPANRPKTVSPVAHDITIHYLLEDDESVELARDGETFWSSKRYPATERIDIEIVADNSTVEKFYCHSLMDQGKASYWVPNTGDPVPFTGGGGGIEFGGHAGRAKRGTSGQESGATEEPTPRTFTCYFHAAMEGEVILQHATSVDVTVSRELISQLVGAAAAEETGEVDPSIKLIIQVFPKKNFEMVGNDRIEIDPPEPGKPQQIIFDLRPTHLDQGEVWVVARQGQIPLVTLKLMPQIVSARTSIPARINVEGRTSESSKQPEPFDELTIIEQRRGDQSSFRFIFRSPGLQVREDDSSKPLEGDREKYVENLYRQIESRWLSNKSDVEAFTRAMRSYGGELFDELVPARIQAVLWKHRNDLKTIVVFSDEPFIPWELVHVKEPGKALPPETKFLGQMGLVRWPQDLGWPPSSLKIREGRARYVIPNYPDVIPNQPQMKLKLPQAELEAKFLKDKFAATAVQPQSNSVTDLLSRPGEFDLLHFACHGHAEQDFISNAGLLMQGRIERGEYIEEYLTSTEAGQFSNLRGPDNNRPLIVLNACQVGRAGYNLTGIGGFAHAFIKRDAGAFVGTLWSVGDGPARTFTETFYSELLNKSRIADAAIKAREAARTAGDSTWLAYVVYGNPQAVITR